jgi:hypothetical protein
MLIQRLSRLFLMAFLMTCASQAMAHHWHGGGGRVNFGVSIGTYWGGPSYYPPGRYFYPYLYPHSYPYPFPPHAPVVVEPIPAPTTIQLIPSQNSTATPLVTSPPSDNGSPKSDTYQASESLCVRCGVVSDIRSISRTRYRVTVHMDDGGVQTVETEDVSDVQGGDHVKLSNGRGDLQCPPQ